MSEQMNRREAIQAAVAGAMGGSAGAKGEQTEVRWEESNLVPMITTDSTASLRPLLLVIQTDCNVNLDDLEKRVKDRLPKHLHHISVVALPPRCCVNIQPLTLG